MKTSPNELQTVLVTDCGSTTTKALLFEKTNNGWRQTFRGEAPTTVEEPVADVTSGALNAFREVEELSGRKIIADEKNETAPFLVTSGNPSEGIDSYLSTSSAGGGLQMVVAGIVGDITGESAARAALGAGAIVLDTISFDDGREEHEQIEQIRHLRPDIVLLAGGTDGGAKSHVIELAELLLAASPRPRFGATLKLPIVYAGNRDVADEITKILGDKAQVTAVPNLREKLEAENLGPAREAIHEFFLHHVMSHSPGYGKLLQWSPKPIIPTPSAVGMIVERYARSTNQEVLCADIGGATTDIFSVCREDPESELIFNRTVSANLGMSYSIANVLVEAGVENISRWLPYVIDAHTLRDRLRNKMIRPTSIPQMNEDLWLEQAVCREALRLSLKHHKDLAVGLGGMKKQRSISDLFLQTHRKSLLDVKRLDVVVGSGGVLSHAPNRLSSALMMLDGFALEGVTLIAVDSIFMMPHLGVFSTVHKDAAEEIFHHDCMVHIAYAVAPTFPTSFRGDILAEVLLDGNKVGEVRKEAIESVKVEAGVLEIHPSHSSIDVGRGAGETFSLDIGNTLYGLLLDGRNRPISFSQSKEVNAERQKQYFSTLELL